MSPQNRSQREYATRGSSAPQAPGPTVGHADKTLQEYASALRAFCKWCVDRKYLDENPLTLLAKFDTTPETERRAMTDKEDHPLGPFKDHPHPFIRYPRTRFPIDAH